MPGNISDLSDLVRQKIEAIRPRLLDLSRRNPLISVQLSPRSNSHVRVVDELPDVLFFNLSNGQAMRFIALPPIEDDPRDEETEKFRRELSAARLTDEQYLQESEKIDPDADDYLDLVRRLDRGLKDRVRQQLGMPARPTKADLNLVQHARNNGITPNYELPEAGGRAASRHTDENIQTLLLPTDLERKLSSMVSKGHTWVQETGLNVLRGAFGFLEWSEPNKPEVSFAPLLLMQIRIEKRKGREGTEFWVSGIGEEAEVNSVLSLKLQNDFGIELPSFNGPSVEEYLQAVAKVAPRTMTWRVRRQVAFGVFPSARMAMYDDLDPARTDFSSNEIVRALFAGSGAAGASPFADEYHVDAPAVEAKVPHLVMAADASQFSALVDAADGKNLAIEGPPGTGKSQTIVNAIAAALAAGKKVLFVAEKVAALEVVQSRLEAVGLGEFVLPLQADRSTRENVIQSIRDRLEMTAPRNPREYADRVEAFNKAREQTSQYVNLIASHFADTGFTVYELLGKSIASEDKLQGLPRDVINVAFPGETGLNGRYIAQLMAACGAIEAAWSKVEQAAPSWRGITVTSIDRFAARDAMDLAQDLSDALIQSQTKLDELRSIGLDWEEDPDRLANFSELLTAAGELGDKVRGLVALSKDKRLSVLRHSERRLGWLNEEVSLGQAFSRPHAQVDDTELRDLDELMGQLGLEGVSATQIDDARHRHSETLSLARRLEKAVQPLVDVWPAAAHWALNDLADAAALVRSFGREVLDLRSSALLANGASQAVRRLILQAQSLRDERSALEREVKFERKVSIEQLLECAATLRRIGALSFLSPEVGRAKRFYATFAKADFEKASAIDLIDRLVGFLGRQETFAEDGQAKLLFGLEFRGLDTPFEAFGSVADFYDVIRERFAKVEQRGLRDFLLGEETQLLLSLPDLTAGHSGLDFDVVRKSRERLEQQEADQERDLSRAAELGSVLARPEHVTRAEVRSLADRLRKQRDEAAELDRQIEEAGYLEPTDLEGSSASVRAALDLADRIERADPSGRLVKLATNGQAPIAGDFAAAAAQALRKVLQLAQGLNDAIGLPLRRLVSGTTRVEMATQLRSASTDEDGLFANSAFATALSDLPVELRPAIEAYASHRGGMAQLSGVVYALAVRELARRIFKTHGKQLARFDGALLERLRAELAQADRDIIKMTQSVLRSKIRANAQPPRGNGIGRKSDFTDMALIEHEVSKKQKHIPVRDLTRRASSALLELKPCWMMSPLAVAQYLPRDAFKFDLCIIDEASQMPPEDSVGALLRSRQTVVVGDTNQLPPTSFFYKMLDEEDADEDETVLNESILEMANATFRPARRLRWHYRSQHSALIRFSNRLIYDDDLVVFPSPTETVPGRGVEYVKVDGLYKSGANAVEAQEVVKAVLRFMRDYPDRSLGVVTLNQKQRELIREELDYVVAHDKQASQYIERWEEKNDGLETFFVKNLENVQGDERDTIFISTVYGPEAHGARVMQRFGPINGLAGKRRLNVLFSRAKLQIVTFSSMTAADIVADEQGNQGAFMLKRWLEYSATGVLDAGDVTPREPDSDFEQFVMEQIRAIGCEPVAQVGVRGYSIDIGVKHPHWPHGFILGIECDGATYHSSKSARDRDRLRQEVLERLGWRFHRIWSTDWFNNPARQVEVLRQVVKKRLEELKAGASPLAVPASSTIAEPAPITVAEIQSPQAELKFDLPQPDAARRSVTQVEVGDTCRVRFLSGDERTVQFAISHERSDPQNGVIHHQSPIAVALLGAEEGDEVEVLVGSYVRPARIEKIVRAKIPA